MSDIIEVECGCGKVFRARAEHAGRTGKCSACGAKIEIPTREPEVMPEEHVEVAVTSTPKPPREWKCWGCGEKVSRIEYLLGWIGVNLCPACVRIEMAFAAKVAASSAAQPPDRIPAEPWYYQLINVVAILVVCLGGIAGGVMGLLFLANALAKPEESGNIAAAVQAIGISAMSFFSGGMILLTLDIARNTREILRRTP